MDSEKTTNSDPRAASIFKNRHKPSKEIVDAVLADVEEFSRGGTHMDAQGQR